MYYHPTKPIQLDKISAKTLRHFRRSLELEGSCVVWTGGKSRDGYGLIYINRKAIHVHRLAWVLANGEIPPGLIIRHRCPAFNKLCVLHLDIGTDKDNANDRKLDAL